MPTRTRAEADEAPTARQRNAAGGRRRALQRSSARREAGRDATGRAARAACRPIPRPRRAPTCASASAVRALRTPRSGTSSWSASPRSARAPAVLLRQRFGDAARRSRRARDRRRPRREGAVRIVVAHAATRAPAGDAVGEAEAAARRGARRRPHVSATDLTDRREHGRLDRVRPRAGSREPRARAAVAVPTAQDGDRAAYEVMRDRQPRGAEPLGVASYVDGRTGDVLVREDLVDYLRGQPDLGRVPERAADGLRVHRHARAVVLARARPGLRRGRRLERVLAG